LEPEWNRQNGHAGLLVQDRSALRSGAA